MSDNKIDENKVDNNKPTPVDKIEWLGMDGLLVFGYFCLVAIMFCSIKYRIDILTGWVFPITLLLIVLFVTFNYAKTLGGFIKMQNQKAKDAKNKS